MGANALELAKAVADKAQALFDSGDMFCAEAVLCAVNEGFAAGLDPAAARGVAMALGNGIGGSGCLCGAAGGAALALSLILSRTLPPVEVRAASGELHDRFRKLHGAACCRVLTRKVKHDKAGHKAHCSRLTRSGAELAVAAILERCPRAAEGADPAALARRRSRLGSLLRRLADALDARGLDRGGSRRQA